MHSDTSAIFCNKAFIKERKNNIWIYHSISTLSPSSPYQKYHFLYTSHYLILIEDMLICYIYLSLVSYVKTSIHTDRQISSQKYISQILQKHNTPPPLSLSHQKRKALLCAYPWTTTLTPLHLEHPTLSDQHSPSGLSSVLSSAAAAFNRKLSQLGNWFMPS